MKTIIVATDFSRAAGKALEYGISLAKKCESRLFIFHSFEPPIPVSTASVAVPAVFNQFSLNRNRLRNLAQKISTEQEMEVDWLAKVSFAEDEIINQANRLEADIIVMGMRANSLDRKLFGSVTTSVIRHSKIPVLVIPEEVHFKQLDKILFACDYNFIPSASQLQTLRDIAVKCKAEVQFLHVEEKDSVSENHYKTGRNTKSITLLEESMSDILHSYKELKDQEILNGIKRGIKEFNANLLVMTPHRTGFLDLIFNRSITRKMVLDTNIPLLTIPYCRQRKDDHPSTSFAETVQTGA